MMRDKEKLDVLAKKHYGSCYDGLCWARRQTIDSIYDQEARK